MKWIARIAVVLGLLALTACPYPAHAQGEDQCISPSQLMASAAKAKVKAVHVSGEAALRIAKATNAPIEPSDIVAYAGSGIVFVVLFEKGCVVQVGRFPYDMVKEHFPTLKE